MLTDNSTVSSGAVGAAVPLIEETIADGELLRALEFEPAWARNDVDHRPIKAKHPWLTLRSA